MAQPNPLPIYPSPSGAPPTPLNDGGDRQVQDLLGEAQGTDMNTYRGEGSEGVGGAEGSSLAATSGSGSGSGTIVGGAPPPVPSTSKKPSLDIPGGFPSDAERRGTQDSSELSHVGPKGSSLGYAPPVGGPLASSNPSSSSTSHPLPIPPAPASPTSPTPNTPLHPLTPDLRAMFPTIDPQIISAVIEGHIAEARGEIGEDDLLDRSIGVLLGMSDPGYKPDPNNPTNRQQPSQPAQSSAIDLDEEFARSLQMQEDQSARDEAIRAPFRGDAPPGGSATGGDLPYQPRVRRAPGSGGVATGQGSLNARRTNQGSYGGAEEYEARTGQSTGQGQYDQGYNYRGGGGSAGVGAGPGGVSAAYEQRFEQFAEIGKQKFGSFLSKAKSKVNEFQGLQQQRQQAGQNPQDLKGTLGGLFEDARAVAGVGRREDGSGGIREGLLSSGRREERSPTMQQAQTASRRWQPGEDYGSYEPQAHKLDVYQPSMTTTSSSDSLPLPNDSNAASTSATVKPYDISGGSATPRANVSGGSVSGSPYPGGSLGDRTGTSPSASKIDASKLGMLPKRRVDLLSTSPNATTSTEHNATPLHQQIPQSKPGDADGDDEFTKNPFAE